MPKRFIALPSGPSFPTAIADMRQGGSMRMVATNINTGQLATNGQAVALSPDQSYAVMALQQSSNNIWRCDAPEAFEVFTTPAAAFPNTIYSVAVSNAYYAVGGNATPWLYVYRKSDNGLESVSAAGLGTVLSIDFSPDGTKMAVGHTTSPYLRVYNVGTWTYTDPVTAGSSSVVNVVFSSDSSRVATQQSSSPYLAVYNADLTSRLLTSTNSQHGPYSSGSGIGYPRCARSPLNANHVLFSGGLGSNGVAMIQLDVTTGATAIGAVFPGSGSSGAMVVDPDPTEDAVYICQNGGARSWTRYKISTLTADTNQPFEFRAFMFGGGNPIYATGYIIRTTPYQITGTVRDVSNNPAARVVRAYDRVTGELMAQTASDASTGNYTLKLYAPGPYDVQFRASDGDANVALLLRGDDADGSTAITDNSTHSHRIFQAGTNPLVNAVTNSTAAPKYGAGALRFNGSAALRVPQNQLFEFSGRDWTIDAQVRLDAAATTGSRMILSVGWGSGNRLNLYVVGSTRKIEVYTASAGTGAVRFSAGTVASDTYTQIKLTKSGNTLTLYQDGTQIATGAVTVLPVGACSVDIGGDLYGGNVAANFWLGYIDDLRVLLNSAVSTAQTAAWPDPRASGELLNDIFYAKAEPAAA